MRLFHHLFSGLELYLSRFHVIALRCPSLVFDGNLKRWEQFVRARIRQRRTMWRYCRMLMLRRTYCVPVIQIKLRHQMLSQVDYRHHHRWKQVDAVTVTRASTGQEFPSHFVDKQCAHQKERKLARRHCTSSYVTRGWGEKIEGWHFSFFLI